MRSQTHLIVRLIAFVLLVFTSACASEKEAPSPIPPNNPQQQLQNRPSDAGNKADEEDEKDGEDDDKDDKDEKD
jgi:hypothetical protein